MMNEEKKNLRENARRHRDDMLIDEADFERVVDVFFKEVAPTPDKVIALYWPVGKEFDCRSLLDELVKRGFTCVLPIARKESRVMRFVSWTHETKMVKGAWGVPEPEAGDEISPDVVIAPLLAFDQKGYRLGQGGGHYDNTLSDLRDGKEVAYIGVGYAAQAVLLKLPREAHDVPLDAMLTPQGLIEF